MLSQHRVKGQLYKYQERNQNFPQLTSYHEPQSPINIRHHNMNIGKILSKYRPKNSNHPSKNHDNSLHNYKGNDLINPHQQTLANKQTDQLITKDVGYINRSGIRPIHRKNVHAGTALNYSQIYNDLKLNNREDKNIVEIRPKIQRQQTGQFGQANPHPISEAGGTTSKKERQRVMSVDTYKKPHLTRPKIQQTYQKQLSSVNFGSKRNYLPGIIVTNNSPRSQDKIQNSTSKLGYKPLFNKGMDEPSVNSFNRTNQQIPNQEQISFNYKFSLDENYKSDKKSKQLNQAQKKGVGLNELPQGKSTYISHKKNVHWSNNLQRQQLIENRDDKQSIKNRQNKLKNSREVGVGNYIIEYKDINQSYHSETSIKQKKQINNQKTISKQISPPKIVDPKNQIQQNRDKTEQRNKNMKISGVIVNRSPRNSSRQIQQSQSELVQPDIIVHYQKNDTMHNIIDNINDNNSKLREKLNNSKIRDNSRVMSTIKPVDHNQQQVQQIMPNNQQLNRSHQNNFTKVSNILQGIENQRDQHQKNDDQELSRVEENKSQYIQQKQLISNQKVIPQESPQSPHRQNQLEFIHPYFDLQQYAQIYPQLKLIHDSLRQSIINVQQVLRSIKKYLEIISSGNMDNLDEFILPLNKKKFVKNALFYERVVIILVGFAYAHGTIKQCHKYLVNAIGYIMNNCMIILKVFQESKQKHHQQNQHDNKVNSRITGYASRADTINQVIKKSDRLAMKRNLDTLRNNNDVLSDTILKIAKHDQTFIDTLKPILKQAQRQPLQPSFYSLLQFFSFYLCNNSFEDMLPFLAVCPNPYLPNFMPPETKYTLIVDPVQLFCPAISQGNRTSKLPKRQQKITHSWQSFRPFKDHFLSEMNQYYQIIFWSNLFPKDVDNVIQLLDTKLVNRYRLYRYHGIKKDKQTILKCVDRLSSLDPKKVIMLDDENFSGRGSPQNCIHIPEWKGNKNETILAELCPLLAMVVIKHMDATEAVKKIHQQASKNKRDGVKYVNFGINFD